MKAFKKASLIKSLTSVCSNICCAIELYRTLKLGDRLASCFLNESLRLFNRMRPNLFIKKENRVQTQHRQRREIGREPDFVVGDRVHARFRCGPHYCRDSAFVAVARPLPFDVQKSAKNRIGATQRSYFTTESVEILRERRRCKKLALGATL